MNETMSRSTCTCFVGTAILLLLNLFISPHTWAFTFSQPSSTILDCHHHSRLIHRYARHYSLALHATSSSTPSSFHSKTARESAVLVEWEPVSNLQRRIEAGVDYEHYTNDEDTATFQGSNRHSRRASSSSSEEMDTSIPAIFYGYTHSCIEKCRLKSAHPFMYDDDDDYVI